jgi:hypothetical protein
MESLSLSGEFRPAYPQSSFYSGAFPCTSANIPFINSFTPEHSRRRVEPYRPKSILLDIRVCSCDTRTLLQKRQILSVVLTDMRWQV